MPNGRRIIGGGNIKKKLTSSTVRKGKNGEMRGRTDIRELFYPAGRYKSTKSKTQG